MESNRGKFVREKKGKQLLAIGGRLKRKSIIIGLGPSGIRKKRGKELISIISKI
jgi:hypothetical protein